VPGRTQLLRSHAAALLLTFATAFAVGAAARARAETEVAALQPRAASEPSGTHEKILRAALSSEARHLDGGVREALRETIARAEREHGIPALLLVALIEQESGFDPSARNGAAIGLMQLEARTAADYARRRGIPWKGEATLRDPVRNVQIASGYLGELLARFESLDLALAAYNKGPECVKRLLLSGDDRTARFAEEVMSRHDRYHARFGGF
jgi:soluble lytic murein transglycosylase